MADNSTEARLKALEERNAQLMAALETRATAETSGGMSREDFLVGMKEAMKAASAGSELLASKVKPENTDHRHIGPFEHPEGGIKFPKPETRREVVASWSGRVRTEELTYAEALALKGFDDSMSRGDRRTARGGKWIALVSDNDERLELTLPVKGLDERATIPSFLEVVQELATGKRSPGQAELAERVALLELQLNARA